MNYCYKWVPSVDHGKNVWQSLFFAQEKYNQNVSGLFKHHVCVCSSLIKHSWQWIGNIFLSVFFLRSVCQEHKCECKLIYLCQFTLRPSKCIIVIRGDSRVSGYPGLSPKIQDLLLLHIDDWPVYMKFIIKCICQSEVRASVGGSWRE